MARAYTDDLRRELLEAHRQGEGSLAQLAVRFRVSHSWAKSISSTLTKTGRMERAAAGTRGQRSKLTPEVLREQLRSWIASQPDLTLAEMQQRLARQRRLQVSIGRLGKVLREMGLRLKKVTPRHRARYGSSPSPARPLATRGGPDRPSEADLPG